MKVLIIDSSPEAVEVVSLCLEACWPEVTVVSTSEGGRGVAMVEGEAPDMVILEINLPDIDGFEVLRRIRRFSDVPVVVLTVRQEGIDRVKGLEMGADDYINKPFSHIELLARAKAVLRRSRLPQQQGAGDLLDAGGIRIDLAAHQVRRGEEVLTLTPVEYGILTHLVRNEGRALTHRSLLQGVWGMEVPEGSDYIRNYIHRLREKLQDDAARPRIILSEGGGGYRFVRPRR
ncbi:MAG: response regulator transcription factor [Dehalococcoidia bacterium]